MSCVDDLKQNIEQVQEVYDQKWEGLWDIGQFRYYVIYWESEKDIYGSSMSQLRLSQLNLSLFIDPINFISEAPSEPAQPKSAHAKSPYILSKSHNI